MLPPEILQQGAVDASGNAVNIVNASGALNAGLTLPEPAEVDGVLPPAVEEEDGEEEPLSPGSDEEEVFFNDGIPSSARGEKEREKLDWRKCFPA